MARLEFELRYAKMDIKEMQVRLAESQMCYASEAHTRKALEGSRTAMFEIYNKQKEEFKHNHIETAKLLEELRIANEVITEQKELIFIYQTEQQAVQGGQILSHYDERNRSHEFPPYQPLSRPDFGINITYLPHPDGPYDTTLLEPPYDTGTVKSIPVTGPGSQTSMSMQSMSHPTPAEQKTPYDSEGIEGGQGGNPSKKRRNK
jgi:hypothetical protein